MATMSSEHIELDGGPDDDLAKELPIPETRQRRSNAHMDRKLLRELWYKALPELGEARKKRNRLVPEDEFQYAKLEKGEIRLLCLHPYKAGEPNSPLFARVFTRRLDEVKGRYEALSYAWGDQRARPREEIHLRNVSHTLPDLDRDSGETYGARMFAAAAMRIKVYRFPIYKNLYDALMSLRGGLRPVILWVDAICIDQSENGEEEKRWQLQMMDEIYESAANVCVWLGSGFRGSTDGIQLAREITNFQTFDTLIGSGPAERRWPELIKLLKLPWFGRRWIIQEIALAREATVHCGKDRIHWDDFAETVSLLLDRIGLLRKSHRDEVFEDVETASGFILIAMLDVVCRKSDKGVVLAKICDLETLVSTLFGFQATHPKDTIFSVLSLAQDPPKPGEDWEQTLHGKQLRRLDKANAARRHAANATKATEAADSSLFFKYRLSTRDIFIAFVTRSIYKSGCLDIVCRHWAPPVLDRYGKEVTMPSWVSPLSRSPYGLPGTFKGRQNGENLVAYSPDDRRKRYHAAGTSKADISTEDDQSPEFLATHPLINQDHYGPTVLSITDDAVVLSPVGPPSPGLEAHSFMSSETLRVVESSTDPSARFAVGSARVEQVTATNGNVAGFANGASDGSRFLVATLLQTDAVLLKPPAEPSVSGLSKIAKQASSNRPRRTSLAMLPAAQRVHDIERTHHLSGVLGVRGFVVGRIMEVSDVMRGGIVPGRWVQRLGWAEDDSNRVPELLWRTLVADRTPSGGHPPPWYKRACLHALHDPRKTDSEGSLHSATPLDRDISEHSTLYLRRVASVVWNRRLFLAELDGISHNTSAADGDTKGLKGPLFGIGPNNTAVGHRVCILLGCSVPTVLGEGTRKGLSRIVGEAYVHGIMDGEAMNLGAPHEKFLLE
ncbi:Heterokaryon incompatibility protein 6, OR allele [Madurella mycetomatis]|uniref:Heterokaryon incompatibility protein 6, OR allele n=1 Tax=Madurella mycetomatis TaxID=100816 RepID=A0A175WGH7_9PEZI|nr:Heterokaryon incompatibility protein 6, OR allele [Madurella mycetomatis]KXX82947.1 Heterokaryon incompatibility protein 6, OR allele [Madurella mycetomatis]